MEKNSIEENSIEENSIEELDGLQSNKEIKFTNRQLILIIIPLFLETVLTVAVGMADTIMVSSVGESAVSGVSLVDTINYLFIGIFTAISTGGYVIILQAIGRKSPKDACEYSNQMMLCIVAIATITAGISLMFNYEILNLFYQNVEKDVMENAKVYFYLTALSYPFLAIHSACASIFRSMGNTKISLYVSILLNVINIVGNYIFIMVLGWNAAGVGTSTLIARVVGATIMVVLALNRKNIVHITNPIKWRFNKDILKKMLDISIPTAIDSVIFQIGKLVLQSLTVTFGTSAIAANVVAGQVASFTLMPGNVISIVIMMVTGQLIGARDFDGVKLYTKKLLTWGICSISILNVGMFIFMDQILGLYNLTNQGHEIAKNLVTISCIVSTLFWTHSFSLPNALRASNDARFTMVVSIFSMWIFRIGFSYLLCLQLNMGVTGIWVAMGIDWLFRGILFTHRFKSEKWIAASI